jgi:hypothetical protein
MKASLKSWSLFFIGVIIGSVGYSLYADNQILTGQWEPRVEARNNGYYVEYKPEDLDSEI